MRRREREASDQTGGEKAENFCRIGSDHLGWDHIKVSMEMPLVISQPMRRSLVQLRQSQVGLRPWVSHTGVPAQDRVLWGRTLPGKDMLSGLGRGQPAIKVPLPSARTFLSHVGSRCWVSRWLSGESSPKAASRSRFCPPGLPQRRDVRNSIPLELPAELPLLLLPPSVVLSQKHEDVPPRLMWLQPTEHLDGSWGKVSATTGNRHPRAASCLSPRPTLRSHSPTMSRVHPPGPTFTHLVPGWNLSAVFSVGRGAPAFPHLAVTPFLGGSDGRWGAQAPPAPNTCQGGDTLSKPEVPLPRGPLEKWEPGDLAPHLS